MNHQLPHDSMQTDQLYDQLYAPPPSIPREYTQIYDQSSNRGLPAKINMIKNEENNYLNEIDNYLYQKENYLQKMMKGNLPPPITNGDPTGVGLYGPISSDHLYSPIQQIKSIKQKYSKKERNKKKKKRKNNSGDQSDSSCQTIRSDHINENLSEIKERISLLEKNTVDAFDTNNIMPISLVHNSSSYINLVSELQVLIKNLQLKLAQKDHQSMEYLKERDTWKQRYFEMAYHNEKLHMLNSELMHEVQTTKAELSSIQLLKSVEKVDTTLKPSPVSTNNTVEISKEVKEKPRVNNQKKTQKEILNQKSQKSNLVKSLQSKITLLTSKLEKAEAYEEKSIKKDKENQKQLTNLKKNLIELQKSSQTQAKALQHQNKSYLDIILSLLDHEQPEQVYEIQSPENRNQYLKDKEEQFKRNFKEVRQKLEKVLIAIKIAEGQIKTLKETNQVNKQEYNNMKMESDKKLEEIKTNLEIVDTERKKLESEKNRLISKNEKLIEEIGLVKDSVSSLKDELQQKNEEVSKKNNKIIQLSNKVARDVKEIQEINYIVKEQKVAVWLFKLAVNKMKQNWSESVRGLSQDLSESWDRQKVLERQISGLKEEIAKEKKIILNKDEIIEEKQETIHKNREKVEQYESLQKTLKQLETQYQVKIQELTSHIEQQTEDHDNLIEQQKRKMQKKILQQKRTKAELEEIEENWKEKVDECNRQINNKNTELINKNEIINRLERQIQGFKNTVAAKDNLVNLKQKRINEKEQQIEALKKMIEDKEEELAANQQEIQSKIRKEAQLKKKQQQVNKKYIHIQDLEKKFYLSQQQCKSLTKQLEKKGSQSTTKHTINNKPAQSQNQDQIDKQKLVKNFKDIISALESQICTNQTVLQANKATIEKFMTEIENLTKKCQDLRQKDNKNAHIIADLQKFIEQSRFEPLPTATKENPAQKLESNKSQLNNKETQQLQMNKENLIQILNNFKNILLPFKYSPTHIPEVTLTKQGPAIKAFEPTQLSDDKDQPLPELIIEKKEIDQVIQYIDELQHKLEEDESVKKSETSKALKRRVVKL